MSVILFGAATGEKDLLSLSLARVQLDTGMASMC